MCASPGKPGGVFYFWWHSFAELSADQFAGMKNWWQFLSWLSGHSWPNGITSLRCGRLSKKLVVFVIGAAAVLVAKFRRPWQDPGCGHKNAVAIFYVEPWLQLEERYHLPEAFPGKKVVAITERAGRGTAKTRRGNICNLGNPSWLFAMGPSPGGHTAQRRGRGHHPGKSYWWCHQTAGGRCQSQPHLT